MLEWLTLGNVNTFLDVISKVRDLVQGRKVSDTEIFDEVIDPIFSELEKVVEDYFLMFRTTLDDLNKEKDGNEFDAALANLLRNREKLLATRIRVRETAQEVIDCLDNRDVRNFMEKVLRVFYSVDVHEQGRMSGSIRAVRLLEALEDRKLTSKFDLVQSLKKIIAEIENSYQAAAQSYARLRLVYRYKGLNKNLSN